MSEVFFIFSAEVLLIISLKKMLLINRKIIKFASEAVYSMNYLAIT